MKYNTDVLIIGAGAVGTAIARELSKFQLDVILCDKNDDVGGDASKSCSSCCSTESTVTPFTLESSWHGLRPLFYHLRGAGDTDKFLRQHNAGSQ
ncbi:MAG: FAD-dependent oxidoreductase [Anaerovoracaceae bacterium]